MCVFGLLFQFTLDKRRSLRCAGVRINCCSLRASTAVVSMFSMPVVYEKHQVGIWASQWVEFAKHRLGFTPLTLLFFPGTDRSVRGTNTDPCQLCGGEVSVCHSDGLGSKVPLWDTNNSNITIRFEIKYKKHSCKALLGELVISGYTKQKNNNLCLNKYRLLRTGSRQRSPGQRGRRSRGVRLAEEDDSPAQLEQRDKPLKSLVVIRGASCCVILGLLQKHPQEKPPPCV